MLLRVPYGGIQMLPTRIMIPARGTAKPDPIYPYSDNINVGDPIAIVTDDGPSNTVTVEPPIADLRIPADDLTEDHDQDGLTSDVELQIGTDPLAYDTDHDKLSDGQEIERLRALGVV